MSDSPVYDAIVIGAGLAGLTAGLRLQQSGLRVLLLERRDVAGGLCGTRVFDGYEFVIGCNDFGTGLERELNALGVQARFKRVRTRITLEREVYELPPTGRTLRSLVRHPGDLFRLVRTLKNPALASRYEFLEQLVSGCIRSPDFADFMNSFAYPASRTPGDLRLEEMKAGFSKEYAYGYDQSIIPEGGPGVLIQRMVERFEALGGKLLLRTECTGIASRGNLKAVVTPGGEHLARQVITSEPRWESFPQDAKPGLALGMFHLAVKKSLPFPQGFHTLTWFPRDVASWLRGLDAGQLPEAFGFHLFASDLPPRPDTYSINLYLPFPRGVEAFSPEQRQHVERYVFEKAERLLPGLQAALVYKRFVSVKEYAELYGLSCYPVPAYSKSSVYKAASYNPERDVFHIGNSVHPPGEHAGAAVLSARLAAEAVLRKLQG
jgi:phytoene dehydrogenase-like protein